MTPYRAWMLVPFVLTSALAIRLLQSRAFVGARSALPHLLLGVVVMRAPNLDSAEFCAFCRTRPMEYL